MDSTIKPQTYRVISITEFSNATTATPKRLRDWVGLIVKSKRDFSTHGGEHFPAGTLFTVRGSWRGMLKLDVGIQHAFINNAGTITQVARSAVQIVGRAYTVE